MTRAFILAAALLAAAPAFAADGWHLENATTIESGTSSYDYINFEPKSGRLFLGHRKEGLQVFDPATRQLVKVIANTAAHSSNGAVFLPEFDLGLSNNEDGTVTPFKLSTLEAAEPMKLGEELDTSHYDPVTKRVVVNMAPGADGTELVVLQAPALTIAGKIKVATKKAEHGAADGKGFFFLTEQDLGKVVKLDMKDMKIAAEWAVPGCGKPTGLDIDEANNRVFVACRVAGATKPAFVVLHGDTGAVLFSTEIGDGNDGVIYDAGLKRIFAANGVNANLAVIEQIDADHYKLVETLGTRAFVKVLAMDHQAKKLYSMTAEGIADTAKKINTSVSPYYYNTVVKGTFTVLTYSR